MTEAQLATRVVAALRARGAIAEKNPLSALTGSGKLDISVVLPGGRYAEVELKRPRLYPYMHEPHEEHYVGGAVRCNTCGCTPLQIKRFEKLRAVGATAILADCVDDVLSRLF